MNAGRAGWAAQLAQAVINVGMRPTFDGRARLFYVNHLDAAPYLFFFSSRRRYTSSLRDWSSDVCSSDLAHCARWKRGATRRGATAAHPAAAHRAEERRVGKECRSRGAPDDLIKNK